MNFVHVLFHLGSYSSFLLPAMGRLEVKTETNGPHAFHREGGKFTLDSYLGTTISETTHAKRRDGQELIVLPTSDNVEGLLQRDDKLTLQVPVGRKLQVTQTWIQRGANIDGEAAGDNSGWSVSLSDDGNVLAVGAAGNDGTSNITSDGRGHVRVYRYGADGTSAWTKLGDDIDGEAACDFSGWSVSLSDDGNVLAVGASFNDGTSGSMSDSRGHVRVYKYDATSSVWTKLGDDIDGEAAGDNSGSSVSLSGDGNVLAVGATGNDGTSGSMSDSRGHVRVYKYDATNSVWTKLGDDIDGEAAFDLSGRFVSLSDDGNVLAVGASANNGISGSAGDRRGHVRVYKYDATNSVWTKLGDDIDGEAAGDSSGLSVSLSGDGTVVAIGAPGNDGTSGLYRGHVRVYRYGADGTSTWTKLGADIDGEADGDLSGISVSLSNDGTIVAVGATRDSDINMAHDNRGQVRIYKYDVASSSWTQIGNDIDGEAAGDNSGWSVSLSGDGSVLAVGANFNANDDRGHVRVFLSTPITSSPSNAPTMTPTTESPSFTPSTLFPTSNAPTMTPTTASPSFTPPTLFSTLPFVGGCPAQISGDAVTAGGHYMPGDIVSRGAIVFKCKSWPNSLFCSQAAFIPPSDLKSKLDDWKQAWDVDGYCTGTLALPTAGCPQVWTSGNVTKYKENDQVSVIKSLSPLSQIIYKCKAWPYSWYCGQLSPLNHNGGVLGWDLVGECTGTISPTPSPTFDPFTQIIAGCPDEHTLVNVKTYMAGDKVSVAINGSSLHKNVYMCREFPYSGYCSQSGFAPGEQYDYMAWTLLGPCDGTLAPTSTPTSYSGGALCTYTKVVTTSPTPTHVVIPVGTWTAGAFYEAGDQVRIGSKKFQCKPWPFYLWCRMSAYSPTLSVTGLWTEAWTDAGSCPI